MVKPIIAVDADETLFDENNAVRLFHNEKYGTNHTAEDYLVEGEFWFYWEAMWGTERAESERRYEEFIQYKLTHHLPALPGALAALQELKKKYELVVVTMRDERSVVITHDALTKQFPEVFQDVHFVPLWGGKPDATKAEICTAIGAEYLIDDSFGHCQLAAQAGIKALLFGDYGWNRTVTLSLGVTRAKDWPAVLEYFDGQG